VPSSGRQRHISPQRVPTYLHSNWGCVPKHLIALPRSVLHPPRKGSAEVCGIGERGLCPDGLHPFSLTGAKELRMP
jgi:hypothetical protein